MFHWLTVIPVKDMKFTLNKREFQDAIHLRYDWNINDILSTCVCGDTFDVDHAMVCRWTTNHSSKGVFVFESPNRHLNHTGIVASLVLNK